MCVYVLTLGHPISNPVLELLCLKKTEQPVLERGILNAFG